MPSNQTSNPVLVADENVFVGWERALNPVVIEEEKTATNRIIDAAYEICFNLIV